MSFLKLMLTYQMLLMKKSGKLVFVKYINKVYDRFKTLQQIYYLVWELLVIFAIVIFQNYANAFLVLVFLSFEKTSTTNFTI